MDKKNFYIWNYLYLILWIIVLVIYLYKIIYNTATTWWIPWLWIVTSTLNIKLTINRIKEKNIE